MAATSMRPRMEKYIVDLQDSIVTALEKVDPNAGHFKRDSWVRPQGGRGQSCVFPPSADANAVSLTPSVLEKAGVNISIVHGSLPPLAVKQMKLDHSTLPHQIDSPKALPFYAAGLSLVIHPRNPHAPTVHANYRYFEVTDSEEVDEMGDHKVVAWWFGGGSDLTPSYLYEEDAAHFHKTLKDASDKHSPILFPPLKKWCDEYFYIPHRAESRGVGGIFFDDLCDGPHKRLPGEAEKGEAHSSRPRTPDEIFAFIQSMGDAFVPSYVPILEKRAIMPSTDEERRWQLLRRGRYVEFNLIHDRGTKFGLATPGARIESILMSLPETARWEYMSEMGSDESTREGQLLKVLKHPREWV